MSANFNLMYLHRLKWKKINGVSATIYFKVISWDGYLLLVSWRSEIIFMFKNIGLIQIYIKSVASICLHLKTNIYLNHW